MLLYNRVFWEHDWNFKAYKIIFEDKGMSGGGEAYKRHFHEELIRQKIDWSD